MAAVKYFTHVNPDLSAIIRQSDEPGAAPERISTDGVWEPRPRLWSMMFRNPDDWRELTESEALDAIKSFEANRAPALT